MVTTGYRKRKPINEWFSVCDRRFFEVDIKHIDTYLATTHISAISMQGEGAEKRAEDLKTTTVQYSNRARRLKIVVHSKRLQEKK